MLVPFGTHVLDRDGKSVGTVNSLVLHPDTQQGVAVVVQQGVLNRREIVVPLNKIASADKDVRLTLRADELADLDLYDAHPLRPMPDHWPMPMGFDLRSFFLVAGNGWTNAVLPFVRTSPTVSGTPAFVRDTDNRRNRPSPPPRRSTIARATASATSRRSRSTRRRLGSRGCSFARVCCSTTTPLSRPV